MNGQLGAMPLPPSEPGQMQAPPLPPPSGMDAPMDMGFPGSQSVDPDSLAAVIASAIAQARDQGHAELDMAQDAAAEAAMMHPIVAQMMQSQEAAPDAMRGVAGGALPPSLPFDDAAGF